jgi:uncharacterized protein YbjQ (UPF0145 family)
MPIMTGLSGNEMFCLNLKGYSPGELVIGNSVFSMGFGGALTAIGRGLMGGEVTEITSIIHEGRLEAFSRMAREAESHGGIGITGVSNELRTFHGHSEFLSVASTLHHAGDGNMGQRAAGEQIEFSTSADGQELYCQLDAGFTPVKFVFGNVAYSVGVAGGILGKLKSMARGEIKEFSDVFNRTRHLALDRIVAEARSAGADAVVGIETRTVPFAGVHEMLMMGTASRHPALAISRAPGEGVGPGFVPYQPGPAPGKQSSYPAQPVSSDLTNEEMWNVVHMGYMPIKLVLGTAVYSLGVIGGIKAMLKGFSRGEIPELTSLIYDAREHAIGLIRDEANAIGADDVVGIRTHITEFAGLLEFLAIGTAVKRLPGVTTLSPTLPPQAIMKDKDTWIGERASRIDRAGERGASAAAHAAIG